ncbi:meiotic recombination protein REC8 homolog isoform X2 [Neolamprologus brichardi]|uniref:meiotic recombination protein REC8 homolog isoform X2 n=1 Tax=Neolamprologus brichardi TaxID=32507 RepID=UPI0003EBDBED|nr:meiotic recombination protein REC8 homolog isoform X2 [Neolamprologus brichardi]
MFYYPTVLKRHTGCFSTIWLAATKGIKVPRRDFLKVNVRSTCDDIINYVLERVAPPRPGLPRPRFSLYLSSQLQYGVVVVYHRQCAILLEELQSIVGQLVKQRTSQKIDMDDHSRPSLVLPDVLTLLEETDGPPDPLFGVMQLQDAMPSPSTLIQMSWEYLREASPEHPELISPAAALENGITVSPEAITLKEAEPVGIPVTEFEGAELVDDHPDTIDFLLAQTDHFPEGDLEIPGEKVAAGEQEKEVEREEREGDLEKHGAKELTGSTLELQPTTLSSEEAILLPQEEPGLPAEKPPSDPLTPVSVPGLPAPPFAAKERERRLRSLELEDVASPEKKKRKRRRRQLIFFDPVTQLSQDDLQRQINDPLTETRRPLLAPLSFQRIIPAADLFNKPCTFLPEEVQFLWRQSATITPLSGSDLQVGERGPESTDSEREREREMIEVPEREVLREMAETEMLDISAQGELPLEGSDQREVSREISPLYLSEGSTLSRSISTLRDIPEVSDELPARVAAESPRLLPELAEGEVEPLLFQSLLPPEVNRKTVSNVFQQLLASLSARKLRVEQDEPYGDIFIFRGSNYEEIHLPL